jgi:hypothetical protein
MGLHKGKFIHGSRVTEDNPPPDYTPGGGSQPTGSASISVLGLDPLTISVGTLFPSTATGSNATVSVSRVTITPRIGNVAPFVGNPGAVYGPGYVMTSSVGYLTASVFNAATKLVLSSQPSSLVSSNTVFPVQPTVLVQDAVGNVALGNSSSVSISLIVVSGTGVLSGTTTKTALSGSAPFTGLKISGSGTFKLAASASGLTPTTSSLITVPAASATGTFLTRIISYTPISGSLSSYSMSVFIPVNYNVAAQNPTILVLGGSGQRGTDNTTQLTDGLATKVAASASTWPTITIFPQWPSSGSRGGREWAFPMIRAAQAAVESEWNCDPTRRYLTGFSLGAMVGFEYLYQQPDFFAACFFGAGYLPSGALAMTASIPDTSAQSSANLVASYTPFLPIKHYQSDSDGVVLPAMSDPIRIAYQQFNPYYSYVSQSGLYHTDAYMAMYNDPTLWTWLSSQSRVPIDGPEHFDTYRHANDFAGNVWTCYNVTDFQTALNNCVDGDRIELVTGSVHVGQFFLRNRGTNGFVEIRTAISTAQLDAVCPQDTRMNPAKAQQLNLATIKCNHANGGINALYGARGYRFTAVNITHNNCDVDGLMRLGDQTMTQNSQICSFLGVDRCVLTGSPTFNVRRAIAFGARYSFVKDSWITDFADANSDSQPIGGYGCAGPVLIQNNQMEGWSEGFIVGGANSGLGGSNPLSVPSDYIIRNNTITRNLAYKGTGYPHLNQKNGSEFKSCNRGLMENNEVFYTWLEGQIGYALNLKTDSSQDPSQIFAGSRHITVRNNYFHNVGAGITINANPDGTANVVLANHLHIHDNLIETVNSGIFLGQASSYGIGGDLRYLWIEHNTNVKMTSGSVPGINMAVYGGPFPGPVYFRSNIWYSDVYGIKADSAGNGTTALNNCYGSGYTWTNNIQVNSPSDPSMNQPAAGNFFVGTESNIGYANYAAGGRGYAIVSSSFYHAKGHDGYDVGIVNVPVFWNNVSKSLASYTGSAPTPPPPSPTPPTIVAFSATPTTITGTGTVTLAWSVSNANTISIDNGVGTVTGTSRAVTVSATTTFTLTATNASGNATATATVTVNAPPPTQPVPPGAFPPLAPSGVSIWAELPRAVPDVSYPSMSRQIRVAAGGNLQAAINNAQSGDEILLAPGAVFTGNFVLPNKGPAQSWIVIRTDLPDSVIGAPGTRMTPSRAATANLAKILTPTTNLEAISTTDGCHNYRLVGLEIGPAPSCAFLNVLVKFGGAGSEGQTTLAQVPHHLTIDRCWLHGTSTMDMKRNVTLNCAWGAVVDSWVQDAHSNNGDSQAILGYNGPGPHLIQNCYCESGHEVIFWGGADPAIQAMCPADVTLRGCHVTRPAAWKGVWQEKNLLETKNIVRYLIEGNWVENCWADAQVGYPVVMKSENQDGTAPYTQTADVTMRYNHFRNVGNFANFAGNPGPNPAIIAARFTIYHNLVDNVNVGIYTAQGIPLQLLAVNDVAFIHNTVLNNTNSNQAISFDGAPSNRFTFHSNVMYAGTYGVHGSGTSSGGGTLTAFAPGCFFENNVIVGGAGPGVPASNYGGSTMPNPLPLGYDGIKVGPDTTLLALTSGSVVPP